MNKMMSGSVLSLLLVAGFAQSARSELYIGNGTVQFGHGDGGHRPDRHRNSDYRPHFENRDRGFGGQIYIQGDERTVIRERTTVFGPGGDWPTVILRESESVRPGSFGGEIYYDRNGDYRDGDYRNDGRYDPFYRRTVERTPISQDPFTLIQPVYHRPIDPAPVYQTPVYQHPQQRTYFRTCTTTIEGVRTCN